MTKQERAHFQKLRDREAQGETLNEAERTELARGIADIEAQEMVYLRPANERLRVTAVVQEERNNALQELARRREALVNRLRVVVAEADIERAAIDAEVQRLLQTASSFSAST